MRNKDTLVRVGEPRRVFVEEGDHGSPGGRSAKTEDRSGRTDP